MGYSGTILSSTDGNSWTSRISGTSNVLRMTSFADNIFVSVGNSGEVVTSSDGISWAKSSSGSSSTFEGITNNKVYGPELEYLGNDQWQAVHQIQPDDPESEVSFSISFSDVTGNPGVDVSSSDDEVAFDPVRIDLTPPEVETSSVKISSDNPTAAVDGLKWAKTGETITLEFDTDEKVILPSVMINGKEVYASTRDGDNTGKKWKVDSRGQYNVEGRN